MKVKLSGVKGKLQNKMCVILRENLQRLDLFKQVINLCIIKDIELMKKRIIA